MTAPRIGGGHVPIDPGTGKVWGSDGAGNATPVDPSGGGGSSTGVTESVVQTAHGFSIGEAIRYNGSSYVASKADSAADADVVGLVSAVADADNFTVQMAGYLTGLSGLTAGTDYYLDPSTAGALTSTNPTTAGQVSKPLFQADSATSGFITNYRGIVIPAASITYYAVQLVDESTSVSTGEGKAHITIPSDLNGLKIVSVLATVAVAPTGSGLSFGVRKNASTEVLSTNLTIDTTKLSSTSSATAPVINTSNNSVATDDVIWIDCDQADSNSVSRGAAVRLGFS
jgi:hypothetical protein